MINMACAAHRSAFFQPLEAERLLKQDTKRTTLKPAVLRIGLKTRWAHSPDFIAANMRKYKVKEKREREMNEFVVKTIQDRRNEQLRELLSPNQLNTIIHPALTATQERMLAENIMQRTRRLSSSPVSMDRVLHEKAQDLDQQEEEAKKDSSTTSTARSSIANILSMTTCSRSEPHRSSPALEKSLKCSTDSSTECSRSLKMKSQTQDLSKQYMALAAAVTGSNSPPPKRIESERVLYLGALGEALNNLKTNLHEQSNKILLPEDAIFEDTFTIETKCQWMTVDIKELITLPDSLISSVSDVDLSEAAAYLRNAAWDHYFFKNSKPGTKFPSPFCKFEEGETPACKFLRASQQVRSLNTVSCLWTQLTQTKVLEDFMAFVIRGNHMEIPPYLIKNGYIEKVYQSMNASATNFKKAPKKCSSAYDELIKYVKARSRCFSHLALVKRANIISKK